MKKVWIILLILFTIVFKTNCLDSFNRVHSGFQYDSEDLAIGALAASHFQIEKEWPGLGRLVYREKASKNLVSEEIYKENQFDETTMKYVPYGSQIGFQGKVYAAISSMGYLKYLPSVFRWLNSFFLAAVLLAIIYLLKIKYSTLLAVIWGWTFLFSPWIVNFAPNLYWVEFTWFIPMLIGLVSVVDEIQFRYKLSVLSILSLLCIGIKAACGYEYISTIMISMIMFPAVDTLHALFTHQKKAFYDNLKKVVALSFSGLVGFLGALLVHAYCRGAGNILIGIQDIYHRDILRRTMLGTSANFTSENKALMNSVNASVSSVVKRYLDFYSNAFHSNIILGVDGRYFKFICFFTIGLEVVRNWNGKLSNIFRNKDALLCIISFFASISWFILAKSHSYIHVHMNYVLWYFGFVQMCLYIITKNLLFYAKKYLGTRT